MRSSSNTLMTVSALFVGDVGKYCEIQCEKCNGGPSLNGIAFWNNSMTMLVGEVSEEPSYCAVCGCELFYRPWYEW